MVKILNGLELAGYIKERQAKQVRALRQSWKVIPRLAIVRMGNHSVIDRYMRLKSEYGGDIGVEVDVYDMTGPELLSKIIELNHDDSVHGIIVQLPLEDKKLTDSALSSVTPEKDVDGLVNNSKFTPATAMAIDWLLAGYNIDLTDKKIAVIGKGRLVGMPLVKLWLNVGYDVRICDTKTPNLRTALRSVDVIVSATGVPGLVKNEMINKNVVVVDAGTASENGRIIGDVEEKARQRDDITITPVKGGVGPLTVAALFDNVITAARKIANQKGQQDI